MQENNFFWVLLFQQQRNGEKANYASLASAARTPPNNDGDDSDDGDDDGGLKHDSQDSHSISWTVSVLWRFTFRNCNARRPSRDCSTTAAATPHRVSCARFQLFVVVSDFGFADFDSEPIRISEEQGRPEKDSEAKKCNKEKTYCSQTKTKKATFQFALEENLLQYKGKNYLKF